MSSYTEKYRATYGSDHEAGTGDESSGTGFDDDDSGSSTSSVSEGSASSPTRSGLSSSYGGSPTIGRDDDSEPEPEPDPEPAPRTGSGGMSSGVTRGGGGFETVGSVQETIQADIEQSLPDNGGDGSDRSDTSSGTSGGDTSKDSGDSGTSGDGGSTTTAEETITTPSGAEVGASGAGIKPSEPDEPFRGQGDEIGRDDPIGDAAAEFEGEILQDNPELDPSDVRVSYDEQAGELVAEYTTRGEIKERRRRREEAERRMVQNRRDATSRHTRLLAGPGVTAEKALREEAKWKAELRAQQQENVLTGGRGPSLLAGPGVSAVQGLHQEAWMNARIDAMEAQGVFQQDLLAGPSVGEQETRVVDEIMEESRSEEQFGDLPIIIGPATAGGPAPSQRYAPDGVRLEDALEPWAADISAWFSQGVERIESGEGATPAERYSDKEPPEWVQDVRAANLRGIGAIANVPAVALGLKEAAEFVGYEAYEVASGRGGSIDPELDVNEFDVDFFDEDPEVIDIDAQMFEGGSLGQADEAAAATIGAYGQYVGENPKSAIGTSLATLGWSAVAMGGAAAVSGRAGLASRAVIQPGEELIGYGGNRAIRALGRGARRPEGGARWAERLFPNNEPLFMSEEFGIRTAKRTIGTTALGARLAGRKAINIGAETKARLADLNQRTPSVRLVRDSEAGIVDVEPAAVYQAREGLKTTAKAPIRATRRGVEGTKEFASSAKELAYWKAVNTEVNTRLRYADTKRKIGEASLEDIPTPDVAGRLEAARSRVGGRLQGEAFGLYVRGYNTRRALEDATLPDLPSLRFSGDLRSRAAGRVQGTAIDLQLLGYNTRRALEEYELPRPRPDRALRSGFETAATRAKYGAINTELAAREYGQRAVEYPPDPRNMPYWLYETGEEVYETGVGTLQGGALSVEAGLYNARRTLEDLPREAATAARSIGRDVASLRDLTLRVEAGRPQRIYSSELEAGREEPGPFSDITESGPVAVDLDRGFAIGGEYVGRRTGGDVEGEVVDTDVRQPDGMVARMRTETERTGTGTDRVSEEMRVEDEQATPWRVQPGFAYEPGVVGAEEAVQGALERADSGLEWHQEAFDRFHDDFRGRFGFDQESIFEHEPTFETEGEYEQEQEQEFENEFEQELEMEMEQEQEQEAEYEAEWEQEMERELESERDRRRRYQTPMVWEPIGYWNQAWVNPVASASETLSRLFGGANVDGPRVTGGYRIGERPALGYEGPGDFASDEMRWDGPGDWAVDEAMKGIPEYLR